MTVSATPLRAWFRNPVSYSFYVFAILFVALTFGEPLVLVLQHLFVPYTVDVSRGFGEAANPVFRTVSIVFQCLVILFVFLLAKTETRGLRISLSVVGIVIVATYFLIISVAYIMPRFH